LLPDRQRAIRRLLVSLREFAETAVQYRQAQRIGASAKQQDHALDDRPEQRELPATAFVREGPAIARMRPDRTEQDRQQRDRDGTDGNAEDKGQSAAQLAQNGQVPSGLCF
jgi:hypothetical protein